MNNDIFDYLCKIIINYMNVIYLFITGEKRLNLSDDLKSIKNMSNMLTNDTIPEADACLFEK